MENEPNPLPRKFGPNKLVRGKIPQLHRYAGWTVKEHFASGDEQEQRVKDKITEECDELARALKHPFNYKARQKVLGELVDVVDVAEQIDELNIKIDQTRYELLVSEGLSGFQITGADVLAASRIKNREKGGFWEGRVLETVEAGPSVAEDDPLLAYYRREALRNPYLIAR